MSIIIMTISTTNLSLTLSDQNGKTMLFKEYTRWQSVEYKLYYAEWCYAERLFAECHGSELDFLLRSVVQFLCHVYGTRRNGQSQKIMSPKSQLAKKSIWTKNDQKLYLASWLICNLTFWQVLPFLLASMSTVVCLTNFKAFLWTKKDH